MSLDDELEKLELALDDHYGGVSNLEDALEETEDAQNALRHLVDVVNHQNIQAHSTEQVVHGVTNYLLDHRDHMDTRAVELKNNQEKLEEVLDDYESEGRSISRRELLAGTGLTVAGIAGVAAAGEYLGWSDTADVPQYGIVVGTVEDEGVVKGYVEDILIGGSRSEDLRDIDDDWSTLANTYEEGVFDPNSDFDFEEIEVRLNEDPSARSEYELFTSIDGNQRSVDQRIADSSAKDFLEYAEEQNGVVYRGDAE